MNIRCPQCQTTFRVDPQRIPAAGARAKCARCGARFMIRPPVAPTAGQGPAPSPRDPSPPPAAQVPPVRRDPIEAPPQPPSPPRAAPAPAGTASPAARAPESSRAESVLPNRGGGVGLKVGSRDPNARAERLARALVSDIVAYHPDRRDESLAAGTLRAEFRDEILKSWEEYVAQVGITLAKSTPFFREALNTILAKGQPIF